jgi:hypothetical protein
LSIPHSTVSRHFMVLLWLQMYLWFDDIVSVVTLSPFHQVALWTSVKQVASRGYVVEP